MATLEELQQQLAALKERYSAVVEGSYSYEADIATIAVNMQAQLDDAQAAASSAGTYAAIAENAADEASVAGAEAGAAAGATAGSSAAQTKYDTIFTQEHTWYATQTFSAYVEAQDISANAISATFIDVYSQVRTRGLTLQYSYASSLKSIVFVPSQPSDEYVQASIVSGDNKPLWLDFYSAECAHLAAYESITSPSVDTYDLHILDTQSGDKSVQLKADTSSTVNDIDFVLRATSAGENKHVLLSAYSASFEYLNTNNATSAYDVLAKNSFILGSHLANGTDSGPKYDDRGVVMQQIYNPSSDLAVMTLQGKDFSDGSIYDVYLNAYSADFKYLAAENAISIDGVSINSAELQQLKDLAETSAPTDYYEDSYFENLWAAKRTDDIYVRRINKFAYDQAPVTQHTVESCPPTVTLALKDKRVRTYTNALYNAFNDGSETPTLHCTPATDSTPGYDPIKDLLVGFWERCNYYKDSNGDVRITAVNGDGAFDKRKADVGTFGPTLWFDIRDSLDMDSTNTTAKYTDIIVSTAPHPELGLHPHPLAMRSDGTVAPYWCCSAYPAGAKDYELVSAYGSNPILNKKTLVESYTGNYSDGILSPADLITYCQNKGQGYGGGVYINFLVQLMFLIKYGTKDSQSVFKGICGFQPDAKYSMMVTNAITKAPLSYNMERGAMWLPLEGAANLYSFLANTRAVTVSITVEVAGDRSFPDSDTPLTILDIEPADVNGTPYYKVFLETDYSIILNARDTITLQGQIPPAGTTDRVLSKYDGVSGYSAWKTLKAESVAAGAAAEFADTIFGEPTYPFRIHGIEYGVHGEIFMDKVYESHSTDDPGTIGGYYRLPWETKVAEAVNNYSIKEHKTPQGAYGADYIAACIATTGKTGYDYSIVVGLPIVTPGGASASSTTGLCDGCDIHTPYTDKPCCATGYGSASCYSITEAGLFYAAVMQADKHFSPMNNGLSAYSGIRL